MWCRNGFKFCFLLLLAGDGFLSVEARTKLGSHPVQESLFERAVALAKVWDNFRDSSASRPRRERHERHERHRRHRRAHHYEGSWNKISDMMPLREEDHFCVSGRLLPRVFLLGAAKSATTSMAANLMSAGIESVGPDCRGWCHRHDDKQPTNVEKELHFFDYKMNWSDASSNGWQGKWSSQKDYWRDVMPMCLNRSSGKPRRRRVIADFTPEYLRMVPLPTGARYSNNSMAYALFQLPHGEKEHVPDLNLPSVLKAFYGPRLHHKLTFLVMLREPLDRMRSLYHCCVCPRGPHGPWAKRCQNTTFAEDLSKHIGFIQRKQPMYSDWMWGSFYGQQLDYWTTHMSAQQFYMIPMHIFTRGNADAICSDISERLGFRMGCNSHGSKVTWLEQGAAKEQHPGSEVAEPTATQFRNILKPDTELLMNTLAKAYAKGAGLADYGGSGAMEDIQDWLEKNW